MVWRSAGGGWCSGRWASPSPPMSGGATALFFLWQRISYGVLSYADAVFYPWRRDAVAAKKGQAFIAEGTDLWRQKKYHEAATLLRQGLALYPQDFRARITPAQYCLLANRRPRPLWLDARDADLRLAQISIGHGLGRTSESLGAAKRYLNGDAARSAKLPDLARAWHAAGDREGALDLAREVRRKSPDYPPASDCSRRV